MTNTVPALPVHDIEKAVNFYQCKLGFTCAYQDKGFAKIIRDRVEIHLWAAYDKSWKWRSILLFLKPVFSGAETFIAGTHSCRIEVEEIDNFYSEFKKKEMLYSPETLMEETSWGTREFPVLDLDRNLLTFYEQIEN